MNKKSTSRNQNVNQNQNQNDFNKKLGKKFILETRKKEKENKKIYIIQINY